jgi:hypothetical protein
LLIIKTTFMRISKIGLWNNLFLKIGFISILSIGYLKTEAQTNSAIHSWLWAKTPGAVTPYSTPSISTDANGNTYVAGAFDGTLTFQTSPSATVLTSRGSSDVFIAKYDPSGNVVWAKQEGGINYEGATAIKYDGLGNIYVGGSYSISTNFDGTILNNQTTSRNNIFIAKFNASSGTLLWIKQGATTSCCVEQTPTAIAVDQTGSAYITGLFSNVTFDPLPTMYAAGASPYNGGWPDIFVVKYNSDGIPQWQTRAGTNEPSHYYNFEGGNGIAVDASGNIYVTGSFNGSSSNPSYFGSIGLVSTGGGGFNEGNMFLAKYNQSTSSWEWAVQGGGTANDYGKNVSLDNQGNVYLSGYFEESGTFGPTTLSSDDGKDYFIAKYNTSGNQLWIHSVQGASYFIDNASKVDAGGNLYFAGTFGGTITVGDQMLSSAGNDNTYVSAWNTDGEFQWVKQIPGNYYSHVYSLEVENNGNIDIATVFDITETFDCTTLSSISHWDLAIAKLGYSSSLSAPIVQASANNLCSGNNTTLSIANTNLNNATDWKWYAGNCGGTLIGSGVSITVSPVQNTNYYVRSEGGCAGSGDCASITITINNTPPLINSVTAPLAPIAVNTSMNLDVAFTNTDVISAKIKWGDASEQILTNPPNNLTVPHTYSYPGVYTVIVTLTDACGFTSTPYQYQYLVVYDPSGGFVTGGGWINSPVGSYRQDQTLNGKAIFGFESKYQKGATVPSGNTEFKFQAGNMNFKSTAYQWLVIAGGKAQYKGNGTINGSGNYGFLLSAVDGDFGNTITPDLFRIKIWDMNNNNAIVYDNQYGTADDGSLITKIGDGSIVIHSEKNNNTTITNRSNNSSQEQIYDAGFTITASPNPSAHYFILKTKTTSNIPVTLRILDLLGRTMELKTNILANSSTKICDSYRPGVYIAEATQGNRKQIIKLLKVH